MIYTRETRSTLFHLNARDIRDIFCSDIIWARGVFVVLIRQNGICLQRLNYSCIYALQLYPRWRTLILSWDYIDSHFTVQYAKFRKDEVLRAGWRVFEIQKWDGSVMDMCVTNESARHSYVERMRTVCMFAVDLTNGQLTPNNNTPLLAQALSGELPRPPRAPRPTPAPLTELLVTLRYKSLDTIDIWLLQGTRTEWVLGKPFYIKHKIVPDFRSWEHPCVKQ